MIVQYVRPEPHILIHVRPEWGATLPRPLRLTVPQATELYSQLEEALNEDHPVP